MKRLTLAVVLSATVLTSCAPASAPVRVLFTVARGGTFTPVRGAIDPRDGRPDLGPYHTGGAR